MSSAKKVVLFYRDFQRFSGGHLKVWDYFNHVRASPTHEPRISFSADSKWGPTNPWFDSRAFVTEWEPERADLLFVAGTDWRAVREDLDKPVLNLIQHPRHAQAGEEVRSYLRRRALRICVSQELADAISATGEANGPVFAIPNGIDLTPFGRPTAERDVDVLICGIKLPDAARELAERISQGGVRIRSVTESLPRSDFLQLLQATTIGVFLPRPNEGFYLPALEGMAAGCVVVCPDCFGNRSFCIDGVNCFRPRHDLSAIVAATRGALAQPRDERARMLRAAQSTAEEHSLVRERQEFLRLLNQLDRLL